MMCANWEVLAFLPAALAWASLTVAIVFSLIKPMSMVARSSAVVCIVAGLLTFLIAVGGGASCDGSGVFRQAVHAGALMGTMPAALGVVLLSFCAPGPASRERLCPKNGRPCRRS